MSLLTLKSELIASLDEAQKELTFLKNSKNEKTAVLSQEVDALLGKLKEGYNSLSLFDRKTCSKIIQSYIQTKIEPPFTTEKRNNYAKRVLSIEVHDDETLRLAKAVLKVVDSHVKAQDAIKSIPGVGGKAAQKLEIVIAAKISLVSSIEQYENKWKAKKVLSVPGGSPIPAALGAASQSTEVKASPSVKITFQTVFSEIDSLKEEYKKISANNYEDVITRLTDQINQRKNRKKVKSKRCNQRKNQLAGIKEKLKEQSDFCQRIQEKYQPIVTSINAGLLPLEAQIISSKAEMATLMQSIKAINKAEPDKIKEVLEKWEAIHKAMMEAEQLLQKSRADYMDLVAHAGYFKINFPELKTTETNIQNYLYELYKLEEGLAPDILQMKKMQRQGFVAAYLEKFAGYLTARAAEYKIRDFFSRITAFFLGWLGYKTEKAKRVEYIENKLKPKLKEYEDKGTVDCKKTIVSLFAAGLTLFAPRAKTGPGYQQSLKGLLVDAQGKLEENSRIGLQI